MAKFRYLLIFLVSWLLILPLVALLESFLFYPDFLFFLLLDTIESYVFWSGLLTGFFFFTYNVKIKQYVAMLLVICLVIIPGASMLENLFIAEYSLLFYVFINLIEALLFSIGLFIGYMVAEKKEIIVGLQALIGYWLE